MLSSKLKSALTPILQSINRRTAYFHHHYPDDALSIIADDPGLRWLYAKAEEALHEHTRISYTNNDIHVHYIP